MGRSVNTEVTERERLQGNINLARGQMAYHTAEAERHAKRLAEAEKALADHDIAQAAAMQEAAGFLAGM